MAAVGAAGPLVVGSVSQREPVGRVYAEQLGGPAVVLAPPAVLRRRDQLRDLLKPGAGRRTLGVTVLSGACLAVHFGTWVPSAKLTSVAMSVALVSTTPVWTALISAARGIRVPR